MSLAKARRREAKPLNYHSSYHKVHKGHEVRILFQMELDSYLFVSFVSFVV
jgi:hypothetical protein